MKFRVCLEQTGQEFDGTKECGDLCSIANMDKIQEIVDTIEPTYCIDQGGDPDWYELTVTDPCDIKTAKAILYKFERETW